MTTRIDEQGCIELPEGLRRQFDLHPGDEVAVEQRGDDWVITPANDNSALKWNGNVLVHTGKILRDPEEVLNEIREELGADRSSLSAQS